jgi:hypothetical protein
VAVEVDGGKVQIVSTGCEHPPDFVLALLDRCPWLALRHIVLAPVRANAPVLARDGNHMQLRAVFLVIEAVLVVVYEGLVRPGLLLVCVQKRPHMLADLQPASVGAHIARRVACCQYALPWLRKTGAYEAKFLAGRFVHDLVERIQV